MTAWVSGAAMRPRQLNVALPLLPIGTYESVMAPPRRWNDYPGSAGTTWLRIERAVAPPIRMVSSHIEPASQRMSLEGHSPNLHCVR
jgi:hypothetical protein